MGGGWTAEPPFRAALAVSFALAAGCAPRVDPPGPATVHPAFDGEHLVIADGARLPVRRWMPAAGETGEVKAVIVAVHGFNDYGAPLRIGELPEDIV